MSASRLQVSGAPGPPSSQERLQSIVECMADGIVILGMDGAIRYANPAAETLFGRPLAQLTGADLGFPSIVGDSTEIEVVRPQAGLVTAELRVAETEWEGEAVRLLSLRDITDRKRAEERAAQLEHERVARAEAEAASHAKSEFLTTMSHELGTPLNAVIGYAEILELGIAGELSADQRKHVKRIRDSARHLLGLVNEVLDLAKVEGGRLAVQLRAVAVMDPIEAALALAQPFAEARGIHLFHECADDQTQCFADGDRVRQILLNLLNNAIKFTTAGGQVGVRCTTASTTDALARLSGSGPWVAIGVSDTGIGIPADRVASIFDPFVQVESGHTRSNDGSGLGLTISRRLARLMGGDLTVSSVEGRGSTFTLWLREATAAQREAARWRADSPDAGQLQGLADIGDTLLHELPSLLESFVSRLRAEASVPGAISLRTSQLADHVSAYVADLAGMLAAIEEAGGRPSRLVADGAEIQTHIAERHGAQRARLGWTAKTLQCEWTILCEEIRRVIRRRSVAASERATSEAFIVLDRLLEQGQEGSVRALQRAQGAGTEPQRHVEGT